MDVNQLKELNGRLNDMEKSIKKVVEGDRQQLDVFIESIKPEIAEMKRDVKTILGIMKLLGKEEIRR